MARLHAICDPRIPDVIDRDALRAATTPISPDILREFSEYLDKQFPVESQALMAGMVHMNFKGDPLNYLTGRSLNDPKLWIVGTSCTGAALAAYRGTLPLYEAGEIDKKTFREIIGGSWTFNSAKAFETARSKTGEEIVTALKARTPEITDLFAQAIVDLIGSTQAESQEALASAVSAKAKREIGLLAVALEYADSAGGIASALEGSHASKGMIKWAKTVEAETPGLHHKSFSSLGQKLVNECAAVLRETPLALELSTAYSRKAYEEVAERLRANGTEIDPRLLHILANARADTGHGSLAKFVRMFAEERPLSADEVAQASRHLWADMTATNFADGTTRLVTHLGKMDLQGFRGDLLESEGIRGYPWMLEEGVVVTPGVGSNAIDVKDVKNVQQEGVGALAAASYFALQPTIGDICAYIHTSALGIDSIKTPKEAGLYMQQLLNEPMDKLRLVDLG